MSPPKKHHGPLETITLHLHNPKNVTPAPHQHKENLFPTDPLDLHTEEAYTCSYTPWNNLLHKCQMQPTTLNNKHWIFQATPLNLPRVPPPPTSQTHTSLVVSSSNNTCSNAWRCNQPHDYFWVLSKNLCMLHPQSLDMLAISMELNATNSSVMLAQETNTTWKPAALHAVQRMIYRAERVYFGN